MNEPPKIDDLLKAAAERKRPNVVRDNEALHEAIVRFLDLKKRNHKSVQGITLSWLYGNGGMRETYDGPAWFGTIRKYVKEVLRRDHNTGQPL